MRALRTELDKSLLAFREVLRNRNLRRLELAFVGSIIGEWAFSIALLVFAYRHGGASVVSLVLLMRWLPAAAASPFLATLADRYPRRRIMVGADVVRACAIAGAAAAAFAGVPAAVVYVLASFVTLASKTFRPAQAALLPSLARSPEELTAANVASSAIESVAIFAGPALAGLLLAATSPGGVFAATMAAFVWSALLVVGIETEPVERKPRAAGGFAGEALAGFRTIGGRRDLRILVVLYSLQTLVAGALNVLIVVSALELLDLGRPGVGFLNSAVGVGGIVGTAAVFARVGRRRLATDFAVGLALFGLGLALVGVWPSPSIALALLGVVGVGNTLVDVSAVTLLQRGVADEVLARVFGALESLLVLTLGLGAILAPLLIAEVRIRAALIVTGALLPVSAALAWRQLQRLDASAAGPDSRRVELLRAVPIFAPLPTVSLEQLAAQLEPVTVPARAEIVRQGDPGDKFYVVAEGELAVTANGVDRPPLGTGAFFGEIALLRDLPRTATVVARTPALLYTLGRDEFIAAVTGHAPSRKAADAVIAVRLASLRSGVTSV